MPRTARVPQSTKAFGALIIVGVLGLGALPNARPAFAVPTPSPAPAAADQAACENSIPLANGDFEMPVLTGKWGQLDESLVPGWRTTATDRRIEIWKRGYQTPNFPQSGEQFVELNATQTASLYQDIVTRPGETILWSLWHQSRYNGPDIMEVNIGPVGGPLVSQGRLSDTHKWTQHSGKYTIPKGQTLTRFSFAAVDTAAPNNSEGNFLDNITFGSAACLTTTKQVSKLPGHQLTQVGDTLHYTINTRNDGDSTAEGTIFNDTIPVGTEYVPGSLRISSGPGEGALTDQSGDDRGKFRMEMWLYGSD